MACHIRRYFRSGKRFYKCLIVTALKPSHLRELGTVAVRGHTGDRIVALVGNRTSQEAEDRALSFEYIR